MMGKRGKITCDILTLENKDNLRIWSDLPPPEVCYYSCGFSHFGADNWTKMARKLTSFNSIGRHDSKDKGSNLPLELLSLNSSSSGKIIHTGVLMTRSFCNSGINICIHCACFQFSCNTEKQSQGELTVSYI